MSIFGLRNKFSLASLTISIVIVIIYYFLDLGINMDHIFYLRYAEDASLILEARSRVSLLYLMLNEPLWLLINYGLWLVLGNAENSISIFFILSILCKTYFIFSQTKKHQWIAIFLLCFSPIYFLHLRQQFALGILLISLLIFRDFRWSFATTVLIHIVNVVFLPLIFFYSKFRQRIGLIIVGLSVFVILLVSGVEPRQLSSVDEGRIQSSGLGFVLYSIILMILFLYGKRDMLRQISVYLLGLYVASYFFIDSPHRFLILCLPFLIVSVTRIRLIPVRIAALIILYLPQLLLIAS